MVTDKQRAFVDEYLIDLNATRAYKAVYKSCKKDETARVNSSRLLTNANVAAYLSERQRELQQRTEITQDKVVRELAAIAFADIADYVQVKDYGGLSMVEITPTSDIPIDKRAAIASIKQGNNGIEVKLHNKLDALDKLGRHLGMFKGDSIGDDDLLDDGFLDAMDSKLAEVWDDASGDI